MPTLIELYSVTMSSPTPSGNYMPIMEGKLIMYQSIYRIYLLSKMFCNNFKGPLDSGPDGDAVSAERSPKSEWCLGLYIPSGL